MDGAADLLVEQHLAGPGLDAEVEPDAELAEATRPSSIASTRSSNLHILVARGAHDLAVPELEPDAADPAVGVHGGQLEEDRAVRAVLDRSGEDLAVRHVHPAVARDVCAPTRREREVGCLADDPDRVGLPKRAARPRRRSLWPSSRAAGVEEEPHRLSRLSPACCANASFGTFEHHRSSSLRRAETFPSPAGAPPAGRPGCRRTRTGSARLAGRCRRPPSSSRATRSRAPSRPARRCRGGAACASASRTSSRPPATRRPSRPPRRPPRRSGRVSTSIMLIITRSSGWILVE